MHRTHLEPSRRELRPVGLDNQPAEPLAGPLEGLDLCLGERTPLELLAEVVIEIPEHRGRVGGLVPLVRAPTHTPIITHEIQTRNPLIKVATWLY